jgi:hypothetical protein
MKNTFGIFVIGYWLLDCRLTMSQRIYISRQDAAPTFDNAVWEWLPATILDAIYYFCKRFQEKITNTLAG